MVTTINLNDHATHPLTAIPGSADVWVKTRWADAWTRRNDLFPVQSVWTLAPNVSTATLEYRFGRILVPGSSEYQTLTAITTRGYWVLIRWRDIDDTPIDWLGYAETPVTRDRWAARDGLPESGKQTIPCFGMIRALEQTLVANTVYVDASDPSRAIRSRGTGMTFNDGDRGNRSAAKRNISSGAVKAYVFADPNDTTSTWWSTRDIVEHLAAFHLPTPGSVVVSGGVPWQMSNLTVLPDWDRPVVQSDLQDVASILTQLINPSRMLSFGIGLQASGSTTPNVSAVTINPFSLLTTPLVLPSATLPANPNLIDLSAANDPLTSIVVDEDATRVYDQVVVQGPKEIAVCTLVADPETKSPYKQGWSVVTQNEYEAGATPWAGFAAATNDEKRSANERYRTNGKLRDVYSLYKLKDNWDGRVSDEFLFVPEKNDDDDDIPYIPASLAIEVLDYLPLFSEVDYSVATDDVDESIGVSLRKPVLFFRKRNADGTLKTEQIYVDAEGQLSQNEELLKSKPIIFGYEIDRSLNVRLVVKNAPQHALAGKGFIGNLGDLDQETLFGDIYHRGWGLTVAIRGDRRPRFSIPTDDEVSDYDVVRRKIVTLDDESLNWIYIAKNTQVGFKNDTPNTVKSPGGVLRDPLPILESLCKMLAAQYGQPRRRATIRTGRRLSQIELGSVLRNVDTYASTVGAVISEIKIDAPLSDGSSNPAPATQQFTASPFRADAMSLLRIPRGNVRTTTSRPRKGLPRVITPRSERRK